MVLGFYVFHYLLPGAIGSCFCAFFLPSCHSTFFPSSLPLCPFPPSLFPSLLSVLSSSPLPSSFPLSFLSILLFPFFLPFFPPSLLPPSLSLFFLLLPFLLPSLPSSLPPFFFFFFFPPSFPPFSTLPLPSFRPSLLSSLPSFFLLSLSFLLSSLLLFLPFFVCWCFISRNVFEFFPRQFLICSLHQVVVLQLKERSLLLPLHRLSACELGFVFVEFYFTHSSSCRCQFSFYSEKLLVVLVPSLKARKKRRPSFPSYFTQNLRHLNSWKKSYKNHRFPEGSTLRRIPYLFWLPWRHF